MGLGFTFKNIPEPAWYYGFLGGRVEQAMNCLLQDLDLWLHVLILQWGPFR